MKRALFQSQDANASFRFGREVSIFQATMLQDGDGFRVHANLVIVVGFCKQPQAVVYEWVGGGDLRAVLDDADKLRRMPLDLRIRWMLDVARGLEHLHCRSAEVIRHDDVKPENIMLVAGWSSAKLADYGAAKAQVPGISASLSLAGTFDYLCPLVATTN